MSTKNIIATKLMEWKSKGKEFIHKLQMNKLKKQN